MKLLGNMAKNVEVEPMSNNLNILGFGSEIKGEVATNGDIRIDGTLNGNITAKGKIVVGETGRIVGNVYSKQCDVFGYVEGNINTQDILSLKVSANVNGDMVCAKLSIEPGAKFSGKCDMNQVPGEAL
ncbi:polymer-forming cytoskeletal protein [uncultured Acetobacteroides sp.]|uniref:bactofilin family protein n=1 Tax=uncultured Acetobacteroides sp. TaxID=1760811 RepID=UPI0029F591D9|nr:polymer-forming cytoskeletal protein [uncultured Acetobacteroides sp.]